MKNKGYRPGAARPLFVCSWVLLALGCGNVNKEPGDADIVDPRVSDPCALNRLLAECQSEDPGGGPLSGGGGTGGAEEEPPSERDLIQAAAENVLRVNCGRCHGPALTEEAAEAGMNYIDDMEQLVENGQVRPRDADNSPIVRYMRDGVMPPPNVEPRPSQREIDLVADFIDNPRFWPDVVVPSCADQLRTFDDVYRAVAADLRDADAEDRPFLRYLTLTNRYNAGICETELDADRWALSKAVNMLSIRARITQPRPIDADRLIYAIDIRDYEWDRTIVVGGQDSFDDGWEAIIASTAYAVPFVGNDADEVREDAQTDVAVLFADAMQEAAAFGDLYYALIDVDVTQPLSTFVSEELAIDVADNLAQFEVVRAGLTNSDLTRQNRVLERHELGGRSGVYWQSFDFEADEVNDSIFIDPFDFVPGGTEAIFTLPNNMLAFIIADADDNIVDESNILLDTFSNDFIARTAVSCSGCHARGFNEAEDEVRSFAESNRIRFNADDFEAVREIYLRPDEFARVVEDDSLIFRRALDQAGVPTLGPDPLRDTFLAFDADLDLKRAAGDLGLRPEELDENLRELDPALQVLRRLRIDRDDFTALYLESLCILHGASENQPDPALCADVLE